MQGDKSLQCFEMDSGLLFNEAAVSKRERGQGRADGVARGLLIATKASAERLVLLPCSALRVLPR